MSEIPEHGANALHRALDEVFAVQAQGTSQAPGGYGPPYGPPWFIVDTSSAESDVNWPGELIEEVGDTALVGSRLRAAQMAALAKSLPDLLTRDAEIKALRGALAEVMDWISNWDPNFIHDDEWRAAADRARAALNPITEASAERLGKEIEPKLVGKPSDLLSRQLSDETKAAIQAIDDNRREAARRGHEIIVGAALHPSEK